MTIVPACPLRQNGGSPNPRKADGAAVTLGEATPRYNGKTLPLRIGISCSILLLSRQFVLFNAVGERVPLLSGSFHYALALGVLGLGCQFGARSGFGAVIVR